MQNLYIWSSLDLQLKRNWKIMKQNNKFSTSFLLNTKCCLKFMNSKVPNWHKLGHINFHEQDQRFYDWSKKYSPKRALKILKKSLKNAKKITVIKDQRA